MALATRDRLADLGDFLAALRTNGLPVGPGEIERLRWLFSRNPHLDRDALKALLSALLVKTREQGETFEALFADWCPDREADWAEEAEQMDLDADRQTQPTPSAAQADLHEDEREPQPHRPWWIWPGLIAAASLAAALLWLGWPPLEPGETFVETPLPTKTVSAPKKAPTPAELPADPVDEVWFWQTQIDPAAVTVPPRLGWPWLALLGVLAVALALGAWWRYRRRFPAIKPQSPPRYLGFGWQPLPPERDETALVAARERRQMVWNVERFVSDDPTRRLDLSQTVEATARTGGFMQLCFEPAVFEREIWFWLDRQLVRSTPWTAVQEQLVTLNQAGLQARRGFFTELPLRVDWPGQAGYRPEAQEAQGRQALVAILTDGEGLARRLNNLLYANQTQRLLRSLRSWPRLCFVDCSAEGRRLEPLLAPHGLDVIALERLPVWLGGVEAPAPEAVRPGVALQYDTRAWAAALALGSEQADSIGAQSLRVELGLMANPWEVDRVLGQARHERITLINWLLRCEPTGDDGLPHRHSLAQRALDWWRQRYRDAAHQKKREENPLLPWKDSLASRRWELEQALLELVYAPESAAEHLARLADDELRDEIRERLAEFAAAEHRPTGSGDDATIYLTWRLDELRAQTRHRLRRLGFAADLYPYEPPPLEHYTPRLVLAVSALSALALAAFAAAGYKWFNPTPPRLVTQNADFERALRVAPSVHLVEALVDGGYRVTVGSARRTTSVIVPEGARVPVTWRWGADDHGGENNAVQVADGNSVVLRAGGLAQPIRACHPDWPLRSLVAIATPYEDTPARQLAIRLLDRGSADQVLLGDDWAQHLGQWLGPSEELERNTQLLVVLPDAVASGSALTRVSEHAGPWAVVSTRDFANLAKAITFWEEGVRPVGEIEQLTVHDARGEVLIAGGTQRQHDDRTGIEWVSVCPGTFTMGSDAKDKMAEKNELVDPPRLVTLSGFQIARTETTNEQYKRLRPEPTREDKLPAVDVNWKQARDFCQDSGGDLSTEAQWEYAARGGSRFRWSFGDDEERLGNYAWFAENASGKAHGVATKQPNPLGLYDMHGNVWEWVNDRYGEYTSGSVVDPTGPRSGSWRVLRGGSFGDPPGYLRSAFRGDFGPVFRVSFVGFRCVRVPPQP